LSDIAVPDEMAAARAGATERPDQPSLGYQFGLIARLLAQSLKKRNGKDGILPGQFPIAIELMANDGTTQRELCVLVKIDQSTMASTLKRIERNGIIRRKASPRDGRQATIHLTAKGRRLSELAVENARAVNRIAFEDLDPEATAQLRDALGHIIDRLSHDVETGGAA
jgi:DNA-binding MarR family transcriptional regulator